MELRLKEVFGIMKKIFSKPWNLASVFIIALFFYEINVFIYGFKTLKDIFGIYGFFDSLKLFYFMSLGFVKTISIESFFSFIVISLLIGILLTLMFVKLKEQKASSEKKFGLIGVIGVFLGILVPGCAACGIGVFVALGFGAGLLALLPLNGLEISILAILILGYSIYGISKSIILGRECKVNLKDMKGGKK